MLALLHCRYGALDTSRLALLMHLSEHLKRSQVIYSRHHSLPFMPVISLNSTSMKAVLAPRRRFARKPL